MNEHTTQNIEQLAIDSGVVSCPYCNWLMSASLMLDIFERDSLAIEEILPGTMETIKCRHCKNWFVVELFQLLPSVKTHAIAGQGALS